MIDYSKAYVTTVDKKDFQVLDKDGNTDVEASTAAANKYIEELANFKLVDETTV